MYDIAFTRPVDPSVILSKDTNNVGPVEGNTGLLTLLVARTSNGSHERLSRILFDSLCIHYLTSLSDLK
jgi:hypothetical protein